MLSLMVRVLAQTVRGKGLSLSQSYILFTIVCFRLFIKITYHLFNTVENN